MQNIEELAIKTYTNNLQYLQENHDAIFKKINLICSQSPGFWCCYTTFFYTYFITLVMNS